MSRIDAAAVRKVARLARLSLDDGEVEKYRIDLARILDHVAHLDELPPAPNRRRLVPGPLRLRADRVTNLPAAEAMLANAPDRQGPFLRVPGVLDGGGEG